MFTIPTKISKQLPLYHSVTNKMLVQYRETERTLDYLISKVPNGLSLLRSAIFGKLTALDMDRKSKLLKMIFSKPIIASEITAAEKSAVISYFTIKIRYAQIDQRWIDPEVREKFKLIFLLSEPSL